MSEDQDNAGEVVAAAVRVALTAAGQLAEQAARRREAALRDAERGSAAQVATMQAQLAAERQLALHSVRDVLQRGDRASVEEFAQAWQQIRSWDDPVAVADRDQIRSMARDRFGVDPDNLVDVRARLAEQAPERDVPAAAAVLAQDTASQREGAEHPTASAGDRVAALTTHPADAGINSGVAYAKALAAQSHPSSPSLSAQRPATSPRVQRRAVKPRGGEKVQSFGR